MYAHNLPSLHEIDFSNIFGRKLDSIILIGPPGAGKGTHGKLLQENYPSKFYHKSTGDMFRDIGKIDKDMAELLASGAFVSDDMTLEIFYKVLKNDIDTNKYNPNTQILVKDGIPRTLYQAQKLNDNFNVKKVFHIWVPLHEAEYRTINRPGNRPEDKNPVAIERRQKKYKRETEPILNFYKPALLININNYEKLKTAHKELLKGLEEIL